MFAEQVITEFSRIFMTPLNFKKGDLLDYVFEKGTRIGLDIGTDSIKIVEMEGTPHGPIIKTVAYRQIPRPPEAKSSLPEETLIIQNLFELWQPYRNKTEDVRLIISDPAVYLRYITIPRVDPVELHKAIKWQAEKFVPFPIEDASVDYQVIEADWNSDQTQMGIIIVAVERKVIEKYLNILKAVKIFPTIIDIAPFAVAKSVVKVYAVEPNQTVLIVDIGYKTTSIVLLKGDSLRMVRNIELAGDHVTKVVAEAGGIDKFAAERMKCESLGIPAVDEKIPLALKAVWMEWAQEIERSVAYCERASLTEGVSKVILCGGGAKLNGLDKFLHAQLGLTVEVANISGQNTIRRIPNGTKMLESHAPQFMASLGGTF